MFWFPSIGMKYPKQKANVKELRKYLKCRLQQQLIFGDVNDPNGPNNPTRAEASPQPLIPAIRLWGHLPECSPQDRWLGWRASMGFNPSFATDI